MDFKEKYNRENFIKFLEKDFLPDDFEVQAEELSIESKNQFVNKITLLGKSDSLDLKVYEIEHTSEHDPRISLLKETFKIMANYGTKRALCFFVSPKSENYRFSLITIELKLEGKKVTKEYSNPRRYSFYLGSDAKVNTPNRFLIKRGRVADFDDLVSRFAVEVVNKEFFEKFREIFADTKKE
ncbi:MAG: restriction endonuclease subunit M, partial [Candidatus Staskawiczbacteria bacterium]